MKRSDVKEIGEYRGFKMILQIDSVFGMAQITLQNKSSYKTDLGTDVFGNITRINNLLEGIEKKIPEERDNLDNLNKQFEIAKVEVQKEFPQEQVLKDKLERLNQLNAELNIKTDENKIIDDFEDIKDNKNSIDKDDPSKNDDTRY